MTEEWVMKDPAAAGAWTKTNIPAAVRQPLLENFAERFRKAAPDQAMQFEAVLAPPDCLGPSIFKFCTFCLVFARAANPAARITPGRGFAGVPAIVACHWIGEP